jgi:hypothetical protein
MKPDLIDNLAIYRYAAVGVDRNEHDGIRGE